jgi:hypothetical protein
MQELSSFEPLSRMLSLPSPLLAFLDAEAGHGQREGHVGQHVQRALPPELVREPLQVLVLLRAERVVVDAEEGARGVTFRVQRQDELAHLEARGARGILGF